MARIEHHAAYTFLLYFLIYALWKNPIIPGLAIFLLILFSLFPDLDTLYWIMKEKGRKIETQFQHHLYFWTHWPLSYIPLIILFIISVIFNFYPEYFLIPIIGIYFGHLIFDSIATGDGIMWCKIPWKKKQFARYINIFASKTDGYHGLFWNARYRKTIFFKLGHLAAFSTLIIIIYFQIIIKVINFFYIISILYFLITIIFGLKKIPENYYKEPPEGRYADYRKNPKYINGLSKKNKRKFISHEL